MRDTVVLAGREYPITNVKLHLPVQGDSAMMYLRVDTDAQGGSFALWDIELACLEDIDKLDGQRIHVRPGGETYDDDTLGTDILGADSFTDMNFWYTDGDGYSYGDILIDFKRIEGRTYRVHCEFTLTESEQDLDELLPEDFSVTATADFTVIVDQENPME